MDIEAALTKDKIEGLLKSLETAFQLGNVNPWTVCASLHIMLARLEAQGVVLHCETELTPINEYSDDLH